MTRGHVLDKGIPGWIATDGAESFFSDILKVDAWSVLRKFELWASSKRTSNVFCVPTSLICGSNF